MKQTSQRINCNFMKQWNDCAAKRPDTLWSHIGKKTISLSVIYNCNCPCLHLCPSLNPFKGMCRLSTFHLPHVPVSSHGTRRIYPNEFLPSVFNNFRMGVSILVSSLKPIQWTCSWAQASSLSSRIRIQARSLGLSSFPFLVHSAVQYAFQRYKGDVKMCFWVDLT